MPPFPSTKSLPGAAEQRLRSGSADERVVSGSAVEHRLDPRGEHAVPFVDAHEIVAGSCVDADPCDLLPLEAEVGLAVVTDVDLEDPGIAGLAGGARSCRSLRVPSMFSEPRLSLGRWILWVAALALEATTALASTSAATASSRPKRKRLIFFVSMTSFR